jgi:predicted metal-dependent hydrolase
MTISDKELRDDFARFIRHEAMRANITQEEVIAIIQEDKNNLKQS